jgi:hypothetical protein
MKLFMVCAECVQQFPAIPFEIVSLDIRNDGLYEFTCSKGHKSVTCLQEQKFEILFEIGAHAILDGYHREAVSSFSASLERFYEFYVKVICLSRAIAEHAIEESWKKVSEQSERQLGAFVCLYLIETGHPPAILSNKWRQFRNRVIHKGLIPEREETVEYGQEVLDLIVPVLTDLKNNHMEEVQKIISQHLKRIISKASAGTQRSTSSHVMTLSISAQKSGQETLETRLEHLSFEREIYKKARGSLPKW